MRTAAAVAAARNATTIVARSSPGRSLIAADRIRGVHHPGVRARLLVPALFGLAAVVSALPALLDFRSEFISTGLPGHGEAATGDHLQTSYRFWLVGHQLESGAEPWRDPYSYQPLVEPQVVLGGWPYGFPFWPLEALFGPVVAWNLLVLAVTFAAGLFAYLWLRELDLPVVAAALGGLAFAIAPYRLVQSGGHLLGWIAVLVPLALWAFERSRRAETRRGAHAWGALTAAALVSIPLSGQLHLALGALPLVAVYAAVRYRLVPALWAWGGAAVAVGVGLLAEATVIEGTTASEGRALAEVAAYSADPIDFLSRWRLQGLEQFVYLGWLTPVLAVVGLVFMARRQRGLAIVLGIAALVPALLALGTNLPLYETLRDVFPAPALPAGPGTLPAAGDARPRGARRLRLCLALRASASVGGSRWPSSWWRSSPPTCSSSRSARARPTPTTWRTLACAQRGPGVSSSSRSSSAGRASSEASTSTTRSRRSGSARPVLARARGGLRVH